MKKFLLIAIVLGGCYVNYVVGSELYALWKEHQVLESQLDICRSYLEDTCSAIDADKDNIRTSCEDIMDANDYGAGRTQ